MGTKGYRPSLINARNHRIRTGDPPPDKPYEPTNDNNGGAQVVETYRLANALRAFFWEHKRLHPAETEAAFGSGNGSVSPQMLVAERAGISEKALYDVVHCKYPYTGLSKADKILLAIDKQDYLTSGEIPVVPNPRWTTERWFEYMRERGCI